jgi:hypothetical protein
VIETWWCGAVRYRVADEFGYGSNCHCSRCRAATGSAFKAFGDFVRVALGWLIDARSIGPTEHIFVGSVTSVAPSLSDGRRRSRATDVPGRGELNLTAGAREQDRAEPSLELPDGRAERRLRQMQALRRASEARLFRDDHEVTQLA